MDLIKEISAFEKWLRTNYLPPMSQLLWYKLAVLWHDAGRPEWITCGDRALISLACLKNKENLQVCLDDLINSGLIEIRRLHEIGEDGCEGFGDYRLHPVSLLLEDQHLCSEQAKPSQAEFTFYRSYFEATQELPDKQRLELLEAIMQYCLKGTEKVLTGQSKALFNLIKSNLNSTHE